MTHPLRIDVLTVPNGSGQIGMTLFPGRKDRISRDGEWARDLDRDLDAVASWKPDRIVTLVEFHEFEQLGVPNFAERVRERGFLLQTLPIRDGGIPDASFEREWQVAGPDVLDTLRSGGRILLHCRAGLGRTGTIAARMLAELGTLPEAAIAAVRATRKGTIEAGEQESYVRRLQPKQELIAASDRPYSADGPPAVLDEAVIDRALGALLGLAIGDALGTTLEFSARDSKAAITGMVGGGPFHLAPGEWTDDTSMAICLAESLIAHGGLDESDLMERFVRWWRDGENSVNGFCFDIGTTTRSALERYRRDKNPIAGSTNSNSAGNGSLMRLAPVALLWVRNPQAAMHAARRQSATTHRAPAALEACSYFAGLLVEGITSGDKSAVLAPRSANEPAVRAVALGSWNRDRDTIRSSGYVIDTLEAALWSVSRAQSFAEAVLLAVNLGDDADTVAAVTGQLAGAIWGRPGIPRAWLDVLAQRTRIEDLGYQLLTKASAPPDC